MKLSRVLQLLTLMAVTRHSWAYGSGDWLVKSTE
jgi:hypothetical protein